MNRVVLWLSLAICAAARADAPDWKDFAPLVGEWAADPSPDGATGGFTLEPSLGGRVLVRKNHASYPKTKDRPASSHEDLMVIHRDGAATKAEYWDNEGHVIHYGATVDPGKTIVFVSEGPGPRFRLTYAFTGAKTARLRFEIAPPDHPDEFKPYLEAGLHRTR